MIPEGFKRCPKCGETKAFDEFYKTKSRKYGLSSLCKICSTACTKAWRKANTEKVKAYDKANSAAYYKANTEKTKERTKAWQDANPEKRKKYIAVYNKNNPEKIKAIHRAYDQSDHGKAKRYAWIKANPERIKEKLEIEKQSDKYAIRVLSCQFKIPKSELKPLLTPEIIEIKKNQLKYSRIIKNNDYGKKETLTNA